MKSEAELAEAEARLSVIVKNQSQLAEQLECDRKTIQRWLKEDPDCPGKAEGGGFNVTLWKLWIEKTGKKVRSATATRHKDRGSLEMQNFRLKNEKLEIENMLRRGDLMHVDEVCKVLTEMMGAFVQKVRGIKHTLAPQVIGATLPEATKRIDRETGEALTELALGDWAKKKPFWSIVYARLQDLHQTHSLGSGPSGTFETP